MGIEVVEHGVAACQTVLGIGTRVVHRGGLEHTDQQGALLGGQFFRRGVEIGLGSRLDAVSVGTEVYGIGVHGDDLFLVEDRLQFGGDDPLLALDNENLQPGDLAQQTGGILRAHAEHVLGQLLRYCRSTATVVAEHSVFHGTEDTYRVDSHAAWALVVSLVLGIDECFEEIRVDFFVFHGGAVFIEELANERAVGSIDLGCLAGLRIHDAREIAGTLAKQPKEVDVYGT